MTNNEATENKSLLEIIVDYFPVWEGEDQEVVDLKGLLMESDQPINEMSFEFDSGENVLSVYNRDTDESGFYWGTDGTT
jgi:hypothetical protein